MGDELEGTLIYLLFVCLFVRQVIMRSKKNFFFPGNLIVENIPFPSTNVISCSFIHLNHSYSFIASQYTSSNKNIKYLEHR